MTADRRGDAQEVDDGDEGTRTYAGPPSETLPNGGGGSFVYDLDPGESASTGVVKAVAAVTDRSPMDLSPLHDVVDTGALDRIVDYVGTVPADRAVRITFDYAGTTVTVDSGRTVRVRW